MVVKLITNIHLQYAKINFDHFAKAEHIGYWQNNLCYFSLTMLNIDLVLFKRLEKPVLEPKNLGIQVDSLNTTPEKLIAAGPAFDMVYKYL